MKKSFDETILEKANSWIKLNQKVVLATVIQTWGSSPRQIGSRMIVNENGNFLGSVSGGCVESNVISECLELIKKNNLFKKIDFKVADKNAWDVGLACGGEISIYIEQINYENKILREIIKKDASKDRFAVLTNITSGNSEIFELGKPLSKEFKNYKKEIEDHYNLKKNGIIKDTQIFIENHIKPIEVIVLGAVHIAQYLIDFIKNFNFNVTIIDPRKYFTSNQRFENTKIINDWPKEAFKTIKTNSNTALIALTHDPKIDDPALQHALKNNFFYIGALGSKKTHNDRCQRLKEAGFNEEEINNIHGPIGIKLGGKSAPEIALSIVSQLVLETNKL